MAGDVILRAGDAKGRVLGCDAKKYNSVRNTLKNGKDEPANP